MVVYFVSGSNTGLGFATCRGIISHHVTLGDAEDMLLIVGVRTEKKGSETVQRLIAEYNVPPSCFEVAVMDLGSLRSVASWTDSFLQQQPERTIDVLICNAGVMGTPVRTLTPEDGLEWHWQVNHVAHQLLTMRLLARVKQRVITLSSSAHKWAPAPQFVRHDHSFSSARYKWKEAYGQSKLANILMVKYLSTHEPHLFTAAVHPGVVKTELFDRTMRKGAQLMFKVAASKTADQGAETTLFVALQPVENMANGNYWSDCKVSTPIDAANDTELIERCWKMTHDLIESKLA